MDLNAISEKLIKACLKKGADGAEVYIESGRTLSLEVRNGEVETVEEASSQGAGLRVFLKGRMAFASSNDLRPESLEAAADRAVGFARITTADENNVLPDDRTTIEVPGLYDPAIAGVPLARKIELAKTVEKLAMADKRISKSGGAGYGEGETEIVIANSLGLRKSRRASSCSLGVSVVAEKGEQKTDGSESCQRRFFADLKKPEEIAAKAAQDAIGMLDPRMVKTQRAAVIFDPDTAGALLGGILAAVHGERVLQKASFLADKLGRLIASPLLTVIDDGTRPKGPASTPFDGEGVTVQKRLIIDKGVLRGFLYNTAVAKRAGTKSTGNASRGGFTGLPGIGPHNFFLAAGTSKTTDILASTKTGLWLKEVTGYGINPVNGQFSGGASGFWIENGKVAFPVKGLTVAGTAEEMLMGLDAVADDLDLDRGVTGPTFRIKSLQIGGE
ncbi:MAG: TldD/PmbA family protein [Candidatus Aminicenantes bacterium]|nr:TldD/PmbA family protein [Candidatus Aminicenantes bacterium]